MAGGGRQAPGDRPWIATAMYNACRELLWIVDLWHRRRLEGEHRFVKNSTNPWEVGFSGVTRPQMAERVARARAR